MSFHITVKDNETGETVREIDTNAFIGGATNAEESESIIIAKCSDIDLARTILAATKGVEYLKATKGVLFEVLLEAVEASTKSKGLVDLNDETEG